MYFASDRHERNFETLLAKVECPHDREFQSAIYILAALDKKLKIFIGSDYIRFSTLSEHAVSWPSGERALFRLAATLYNSGAWPVEIGEVFCSLDDTNTHVALEALRLRYA